MSKNPNRQMSRKINYTSLGLANGLVLGGFVGILVGNPIIFAGGGMVLGLAVGTALDKRNQQKNSFKE